MRVLVCGSRHFQDYPLLIKTLSKYPIDVLISGGARGADFLGERYAGDNGIPVEVYPADWEKHGKAAGPIRNLQMLKEGKPDLVIAFLAKDSRGTKNMVEIAQKAGITTHVVNI